MTGPQREATRLLYKALHLGLSPANDVEYRELLGKYRADGTFSEAVQEAAIGLELVILDVSERGLIIAPSSRESRFSLRLADLRQHLSGEQKVALVMAHLAISAVFFPTTDRLEDDAKTAVPCDTLETEPITIPDEVAAFANELISKFREQNHQVDTLRGKAREAFRVLTKAATSKELSDVEPELARDVADSEFEPARSDRVRIAALIEDRISATRDTLDGMKPDFENCVGELYNLTYEGIGLLNHACAKTMPISTLSVWLLSAAARNWACKC